MRNIALAELKESSNLYKDYLQSKPIFNTFFPNNERLGDIEFLKNTAESFANRNATIKSISGTMANLNLSDMQKSNLELFKQSNSLAVVTGQQIGFLGGPLYTFYKIQSAIQFAKDLKLKHPTMEIVPVFWLEDNDHDAQEASYAHIYNNNIEITEVSSMCGGSISKREYVSKMQISEEFVTQLEAIVSQIPQGKYKEEAKDLIFSAYKTGISCSEAFLNIIQTIFADTGLLFLSASVARELGYTRYVALLEISNQWKSVELISRANKTLKDEGYHVQAKHSDVNLFYYSDGEKNRIEVSATNDYIVRGRIIPTIDITDEIIEHPERFSPNVLLRPLFQDSILPNIAYIGGAAEIAYSCQIYNLYDVFAIRQPAIINRHHGLIINNSTKEFLDNKQLRTEYFFEQYNSIEKELIDSLKSGESDKELKLIKDKFADEIFALKEKISKYDINLSNSADVLLHNVNKEFDRFEKKMNSSVRSKNAVLMNKYKAASNWISPLGNLQERILTPANLIAEFGIEEFKKIIVGICQKSRKDLWIIGE